MASPLRITLRDLTPADLDSVHILLSDWKVVQYMMLPYCARREESEKYLRDLLAEGPGSAWHSIVCAIENIDSHEIIGVCGIAIIRGAEQGEIWYLVRPDCWRRGVAQEAARRLLALGFGEMNLHRVFATCLPENPASSRVLEKVGMRLEGRQRSNLKIHGEWRDSLLYGIVRDEWEQTATAADRPAALYRATAK